MTENGAYVTPTITVPVVSVEQEAVRYLAHITTAKHVEWKKLIDKEYNAIYYPKKVTGFTIIDQFRFPDRHSIEVEFGLPEDGKKPRYLSHYFGIFEKTWDETVCEQVIQLYKNKTDANITLAVCDYNTFRGF